MKPLFKYKESLQKIINPQENEPLSQELSHYIRQLERIVVKNNLKIS